MDGRAPLDILIVTGPLGAGKTTVVNHLLKAEVAAGRRVAVLINEFGAISVDGALVDAERPELAGVENLVNGCVCCSLRDDVVATLRAWCDQPEGLRPERVVLETTGLADPTDLLDLEHEPALEGRLRLAGLLTVISCLTPVDHLKTKPLLHRQTALASLVHGLSRGAVGTTVLGVALWVIAAAWARLVLRGVESDTLQREDSTQAKLAVPQLDESDPLAQLRTDH